MHVERIDHVTLRIPDDGVETAVGFYTGVLRFEPMKLEAYRAGERTSFLFSMGETAMLTIRPVEAFTKPDDTNYDHCCLVVDTSIEEVTAVLDEHGIGVERESTPLGSTGRAPAVYVRDPFGYLLEIKESG